MSQGKWWYWLTCLSAGTMAWVPFLHAGSVLHDRKIQLRAVPYGAIAAVCAVVINMVPQDELGEPTTSGGQAISTVCALVLIGVIAAACIQLRPLRRRVYGIHDPHALPPTRSDLAVADAIADRERRAKARALVEKDPALARDLHIGRPQRGGDYDDGGLVDLNTATPDALMTVIGLSPEVAMKLVAIRESYPEGFDFVDEAIAYVQMSEVEEQALRERAIVVPI